MDHISFRFAVDRLTQAARNRHTIDMPAMEAAAEQAMSDPDGEEACATVLHLLQRRPRYAPWWRILATLHLRAGKTDEARQAMQQAIVHAGHDATLLLQIGHELRAASIATDPLENGEVPPGQWPAGTVGLLLRGELEEALPALERAYAMSNGSGVHARNLAFAYRTLGHDHLVRCVEASVLLAKRDAKAAVRLFESLGRSSLDAGVHLGGKYLRALRQVGRDEQLFKIAEAEQETMSASAWLEWGEALMDANRDEEATAVFAAADTRFDNWQFKLRPCIAFPAVPSDAGVVERASARMQALLDALERQVLSEDPSALACVADVVAPNFHLSYHVDDESNLFRLAAFTARVFRQELPRFSATTVAPATDIAQRRIRIGYVVSSVRFQTIVGYFINWFRLADRTRFELHLFPLEENRDALTGFVEQDFDIVHPASTGREQAAQRISATGIDVLVYLEVGMSPLSHALSSLRLAPVQCLAAGHPVSSGMDSIDYFLSPESMEPANAQAHYRERLELLPGVGICMPSRRDPTQDKTRADFDLEPHSVVFTSPQSLWKYRPGDEHAYARILAGTDNDAIMLFVDEGMPARARAFGSRLRAACEALGVDFDARVRITPRKGYADYLALQSMCDVFLDSFHWSGGVTTFDALALGVPVVTLPGTRMRGRQSYGMLKEMGIEDTIACSVDDYVRIACGLARDPAWRKNLSARIFAAHTRLFDDKRSIVALESFFMRCTRMGDQDEDAPASLANPHHGSGIAHAQRTPNA